MVAPYGDRCMQQQVEDLETFLGNPSTGRGVVPWRNVPSPFVLPEIGEPTEAPPGTREKLLVMCVREGRSEDLFHPFDARYENDPRPVVFFVRKLSVMWKVG